MCSSDVFLGLLALLFPPLAVWVKCGICSADSLINILLCMLGYVPGLLHAWYIIAKFPEPDYDYERVPQDSENAPENGRVTYVIVQDDGRRQQRTQAKPGRQGNMTYGTTSDNRNGSSAAGVPSNAPAPAPTQGPSHNAGEGSSDGAPPPSYAQVVAGDNKIQSRD